jgi:N-acetylglucosaminyl-diphospho-decaprenol L-rhamnosyltransferase
LADLAVVIVSWNVRDLLQACLDSLLLDLSRSGLNATIHVVDNASADGTPELVAEGYPQVRLTAGVENLGFAAGNNLALREIMGTEAPSPRLVWLLNPDTEVLPGATRALATCLDDEPAAGIAGAKLLYADGSLQHSAFRFPGLTQLVFELYSLPARFYETGINGRYAPRTYAQTKPFLVDHPLGASIMVRTDAIAQVGLMDEAYHMYCEEIDWCWRMRRQGWRAYCAPAANILHHAGQSSAQVPVASFTNLWRSRARLYSLVCGPLRLTIARHMVRVAMRRRARSASPETSAACEEVARAWQGAS